MSQTVVTLRYSGRRRQSWRRIATYSMSGSVVLLMVLAGAVSAAWYTSGWSNTVGKDPAINGWGPCDGKADYAYAFGVGHTGALNGYLYAYSHTYSVGDIFCGENSADRGVSMFLWGSSTYSPTSSGYHVMTSQISYYLTAYLGSQPCYLTGSLWVWLYQAIWDQTANSNFYITSPNYEPINVNQNAESCNTQLQTSSWTHVYSGTWTLTSPSLYFVASHSYQVRVAVHEETTTDATGVGSGISQANIDFYYTGTYGYVEPTYIEIN